MSIKRRWVVKYDRKNECWCAFPSDWPFTKKGAWVFNSWQDAMDYANANGKLKLKHISRRSPVRFE